MVFRMNTLQGSMTVLGNKMAFEIPNVPGRAIWSSGNQFTEVQAPLLSDEDLKRSLVAIAEEFKDGKRANFAQMAPMMREAPVEKVDVEEAKELFVESTKNERV